MVKWIPVQAKLPNTGVRVIVWEPGRLPVFAWRDEEGRWIGAGSPTHWAIVRGPE